MYFNKALLFDLEQNVNNLDILYAHIKEDYKEKLKEHMDLTYEYFLKVVKEKNLELVFKNIQKSLLENCDDATINTWKELISNAIYLHDIGKINANFQYKIMNNENYKGLNQVNTKHSMLSTCIYFDYYFDKIMDLNIEEENTFLLLSFLILNSYIISKHHSSLAEFSEFKDALITAYKTYGYQEYIYSDYKVKFQIKDTGVIDEVFKQVYITIEEIEKGQSWKGIDIYIYTKLLFSLLVTSDFYATSHYVSGKSIGDLGLLNNHTDLYNIFKEGSIYKGIDKYRKHLDGKGKNPFRENDINLLRSQIFLESEKNLIRNIDKQIFYLEAPTGSGKTNSSINLAFNIINKDSNINKIFYIFPFNTLVEQTKKSLDKVFKDHEDIKNKITIINSITPIKTEDIEETGETIIVEDEFKDIDYEKSLLNRQFLHYPIILTTHVNFFNYLFGNSRESVFPLSHIANSVVILDEIQSYKNHIWKEIIVFLKKYAEVLNIKIIIMSATLPKLDSLIGDNRGFISLIENREKYYNNPLFKNRVKLDYSLLDEKVGEDDRIKSLIEKIINVSQNSSQKILIEFIKKCRAVDMHEKILNLYADKNIEREVLLITGDDSKIERKNIIDKVQNKTNITLISTQVVEAGVDIDMDIGFKDISILDSEEQFLGRINRSCLKDDSIVYFFNLDEPSSIYKNDYRKNKSVTLINSEIRNLLDKKEFDSYYETIMKMIQDDLYRNNDKNIDRFRQNKILKLDYPDITNHMKLIDDDKKEHQVFLNREIEDDNGNIIVGQDIWDKFTELIRDNKIDYAEKRVRLSYITEKMDCFMYAVTKVHNSYRDVVGNIFYIEDGEKYFKNGKFNRELFENNSGFEML